jgi:acyl-coenzyme A synthetase/AMP-(fatty) acid ligase
MQPVVNRSPNSLFPPFSPTLPSVLAHAVDNFGDREFLASDLRRLTFAEVDEESATLARGLLALGVGKGSRVGIMMPNSPDWIVCWLAAARIGALTVPISTFYQAPELRRVLDHADIDTLLMIDRYLKHDYVGRLESLPGIAEQAGPELAVPGLPYLRHVVVWGEETRPWLARGPEDLVALAAANPRIDRQFLASVEDRVMPADDLFIIYTSGSTSEPKAVVHTHAGVVRLCYALLASGWADVHSGDRLYGAVPFFWIGGPNSTLLPAMLTGACIVMSASPDIDEVVDICAREGVTSINAWTPQLKAIDERASSRGIVFPHLRSRLHQLDESGELIPPELIPNPFGMTETFGPHGLEPQGTRLPEEKVGAFGRTLQGMERKVVDPDTGRECGVDEFGELYVRGFSLMRGFYKRLPEDTFDPDGFYATGDRCRIDAEGFMYFEGRFGEMIKTGGANVAPREVEVAIERCGKVREAIVFGIPDSDRGEAIVAVVVPTTGTTIDRHELTELLKEELSHYKVPHFIFVMDNDQIPRTDSNKVKKHLLKSSILERWELLLAATD